MIEEYMKIIRLDLQASLESASMFQEVAHGKIILTDSYGQQLIHEWGWTCEALIVVEADPLIKANELNTNAFHPVLTISDGLKKAWDLRTDNQSVVALNRSRAGFSSEVFKVCKQTHDPYGDDYVGYGRAAHWRTIRDFFWQLKRTRKEKFKDIAARMGFTQGKFGHFLTGTTYPIHAIREKIAEGFEVPASEVHALFEDYHSSVVWYDIQ